MKISDCIEGAAVAFGLPVVSLTGPSRRQEAVHARWAAMLLARRQGYSSPRIARSLDRDHSTVLHGVARGRELVASDEEYAEKVAAARATAEGLSMRRRGAADGVRDWLLVGTPHA